MKKSLPLLAGAIVVPLLAATVAAFAASSTPQAPAGTLPTSVSTQSSSPAQAPVEVATPPQNSSPLRQEVAPAPVKAPAVLVADQPETPTTTTTTTTRPTEAGPDVPPNQWQTPEPAPSPTSSVPSAPIDMAVSWDGLKCARSDAWIVSASSGAKMMCPGSANPE